MFRGINAVNIDSKGRIAIPTKYRSQLMADCNGRLVVTIDTESSCLLLYPLPEWELIEAKLQALPSFNPQARRIQRLLIGHATDIELDGSGRVLLPPLLRDYAELNKTIMLVGQGKKFEIWDESLWTHGREQWLASTADVDSKTLPEDMQSLAL